MSRTTKLIILRGNSGSGKTSTAKSLQKALGYGTMLISQDVVRREMLYVKDMANSGASELLLELSLYGKRNCRMIILEGILDTTLYKNMFVSLQKEFKDNISAYYFDIPFDETLRRHEFKSNAHEFGAKEMRQWWNDKDLINFIPETLLYKEQGLDEIVDLIYQEVNK